MRSGLALATTLALATLAPTGATAHGGYGCAASSPSQPINLAGNPVNNDGAAHCQFTAPFDAMGGVVGAGNWEVDIWRGSDPTVDPADIVLSPGGLVPGKQFAFQSGDYVVAQIDSGDGVVDVGAGG
ncbi:MAG: hypothetical protein ACYDAY_00600 [Candidatus Dormibacteria bacterium]